MEATAGGTKKGELSHFKFRGPVHHNKSGKETKWGDEFDRHEKPPKRGETPHCWGGGVVKGGRIRGRGNPESVLFEKSSEFKIEGVNVIRV